MKQIWDWGIYILTSSVLLFIPVFGPIIYGMYLASNNKETNFLLYPPLIGVFLVLLLFLKLEIIFNLQIFVFLYFYFVIFSLLGYYLGKNIK